MFAMSEWAAPAAINPGPQASGYLRPPSPADARSAFGAGHAAAKFPQPFGAGGYREPRGTLARRWPPRAGVQLRDPHRPRCWLRLRGWASSFRVSPKQSKNPVMLLSPP